MGWKAGLRFTILEAGMVAHSCNPGYLGGGDQRGIHFLKYFSIVS
jgi:hypothetical protein